MLTLKLVWLLDDCHLQLRLDAPLFICRGRASLYVLFQEPEFPFAILTLAHCFTSLHLENQSIPSFIHLYRRWTGFRVGLVTWSMWMKDGYLRGGNVYLLEKRKKEMDAASRQAMITIQDILWRQSWREFFKGLNTGRKKGFKRRSNSAGFSMGIKGPPAEMQKTRGEVTFEKDYQGFSFTIFKIPIRHWRGDAAVSWIYEFGASGKDGE